MVKNYATKVKEYCQEEAKINKVIEWISSHVEKTIYYGVPTTASLYEIVLYLYHYAAINSQFEKNRTIADYNKILKAASQSISQKAWYAS